MNLYFRLLLILFKSNFAKKIGLLDESSLWFRAWPYDCDINFHLTNARYFAFCDLCRIYYLGQVGTLFDLIERKWLPVAQAQEISYFRPIKPFQRFEIKTRFTHWDEKYWYTEHRFFAVGKLCATLQVRGVFVHRNKTLPMSDILTLVDEEIEAPAKPDHVEYWQKLIEMKKTQGKQQDK